MNTTDAGTDVSDWLKFRGDLIASAESTAVEDGIDVVARYGELRQEYDALAGGIALVDRCDRALLEIGGADRATWLHNLTTSSMKTILPGEGCYTFALNVQGRILFDLNALVRTDSIAVDLDRGFLEFARGHFDKYIIMEDVTLTDRTDDFVRMGLSGAGVQLMLTDLGAPHAATLPILGQTRIRIADIEMDLARTDFCGPAAVDLFVPTAAAATVWRHLTDSARPHRAMPVGAEAVDVRRIEAGIPRSGCEITDDALPDETGQFQRAVNTNKGCYLGQEIVERMRSRGVVARRLMRLAFAGKTLPPPGTKLENESGSTVGVVTSSCRSVGDGDAVGLGYVKTAVAKPGTQLRCASDGDTSVTLAALSPEADAT